VAGGILNRKYPNWQDVRTTRRFGAQHAGRGARGRSVLLRYYRPDEIACCYPQDLDKFIGRRHARSPCRRTTRWGDLRGRRVCSLLGPPEADQLHYAKALFDTIKASPFRKAFKVIVGGSGGWQLLQTGSCEPLGVDCVVEGRAESEASPS